MRAEMRLQAKSLKLYTVKPSVAIKNIHATEFFKGF